MGDLGRGGGGGGVKECLYAFLTSPIPIYQSLSALEHILPKDYTKHVEDIIQRDEVLKSILRE